MDWIHKTKHRAQWRHLVKWQRTFDFYEMLLISQPAESQTSEERFILTELVNTSRNRIYSKIL